MCFRDEIGGTFYHENRVAGRHFGTGGDQILENPCLRVSRRQLRNCQTLRVENSCTAKHDGVFKFVGVDGEDGSG